MNHVRFAFAILAAVIAVSIGSEYITTRECRELRALLTELKFSAEMEDKDKAEQLCEAVGKKWNEAEPLFSCIVPLEKVYQTEQSICRLKPLLDSDSDELEAEVSTALILCSRICS